MNEQYRAYKTKIKNLEKKDFNRTANYTYMCVHR